MKGRFHAEQDDFARGDKWESILVLEKVIVGYLFWVKRES